MKTLYADDIYQNGEIYVNNADKELVSAMAVKDGKIIAVGSDEDMRRLKGDKTAIHDLKGQMVLPGMIDCHIHPPGNMLYELFDINLFGLSTKEEVLAEIKHFVDSHPDDEVYYGSGFHISIFNDGKEASKGPSKRYLDEICPDKGMMIFSEDMHNMWANSKAFEMANVNEDTPDPEGGRIERDDLTGMPWGIMREMPAMSLLPPQEFNMEQKKTAIKAFQNMMNGFGYTGMVSLGGMVDVTDALAEMAKEGTLTLRTIAAYYLEAPVETDIPLAEQIEIAKKWRQEWNDVPELFKVSTIKLGADGVVEGITAALIDPYLEAAGKGNDYHGEPLFTPDELEETCYEANKNGFQVHIHSIGDLATKMSLDAFEKIKQRGLDTCYRNTLTHLQVVDRADIQRFADLNVIAATQPYWHFKEQPNGLYDMFEVPFLGKERAEKEYPLASFARAGVVITASSDHGATPVPNPFFAIQTGVTRNLSFAKKLGLEPITDQDDERYLLDANERLSVAEMIDAFTSNAAFQCFRENEVGTLEPGKYADFVVIDQNIFKTNPVEIERIQVLQTVFGGDTVYMRDD